MRRVEFPPWREGFPNERHHVLIPACDRRSPWASECSRLQRRCRPRSRPQRSTHSVVPGSPSSSPVRTAAGSAASSQRPLQAGPAGRSWNPAPRLGSSPAGSRNSPGWARTPWCGSTQASTHPPGRIWPTPWGTPPRGSPLDRSTGSGSCVRTHRFPTQSCWKEIPGAATKASSPPGA